ncbi:MAG: ferredoxin [Firmicutes bacterium]|nr:ferredoxin [Bacillota bacterium]
MIQNREQASAEAAIRIGQAMLAAAITAPKGNGVDDLNGVLLTGEEKDALAAHMRDIAEETGEDFYARDAGNVDNSFCVVLLWAENAPLWLTNCGLCGFRDCGENMDAGAVCAFNVTDLGIAVGSAVSLAADNRMDNRVLFSAGKGAARMGLFDEDIKVCYGIPLSVSSKSVFFDRGPGDVKF